MLDPQVPLAQAAYKGKVVRVDLLVRQEEASLPVEATTFPVLDQQGRQVGAVMVCRGLGSFPEPRTRSLLA